MVIEHYVGFGRSAGRESCVRIYAVRNGRRSGYQGVRFRMTSRRRLLVLHLKSRTITCINQTWYFVFSSSNIRPTWVFGPVVFLAKSIMQRTWLRGLSWDEPLSTDIHDEWAAFVTDLPSLLSICVPRNFNSRRNAQCYLLGFCDTSQRGYAAVVYLRMVDVGVVVDVEDSVFLVSTKTNWHQQNP